MTGQSANTGRSGAAPAPAETVLGLGTVAVALLALWQTSIIPVSPLYSKVGPTIFPYIASGLLLMLGLLLTFQGLRGGWQPEDEKEIPLDWRSMLFVIAGLAANVILIGPLGFTIASTVMFTLIAWAFGSRTPWRDAPIGFVLALAAYFGFAAGLGVNIGMGPFERAVTTALGV